MHNNLKAGAHAVGCGESGLVARLRLVIALLRPWQRAKMLCLVTERIALGVCDLLLAAAMYLLFEELQGRSSFHASGWLPHTALATTYWTIGIVVLRVLLDLSVSRSATQFSQGIYAELLMRLTRGYGELRWNHFVRQNRSELIKHCMTTALDAAYAYQIYLELVSGLVVVVIMSAALVYKSPAVSFGLLYLVALLFLLHRYVLRRRLQDAAKNRERVVRTLQRVLTDMFSAAKEIRAYNNQQFFHERLRTEVAVLGENNVKLALLPQISRVLAEQGVVLLFLCIVLVVLLKGGDIRQILSLLLFYFVISRRMLPILSQLALLNSQLEGAHENLQITHRELEECAARREDVVTEREPEPGFALQLRDVRYSFEVSSPILNGVSLDVREGEIVLLRGISGSGKSSLINLVAGVAQPSEGVLRVHRMGVAYVPQEIAMLDDSVRNNLLFGLPHMDDDALYSALSVANLDGFVRDLPQELQTRVGDSGVLLSGGQRQRLGIARAVLRNARLLLLDEATSALDEGNEAEILTRLAISGRTVLLVTHRRHRGHQASRVLHLQNGMLSEAGEDNSVDASMATRS